MTDIIKIYKDILEFSGMSSDEKGLVSIKVGSSMEPALIKGERLVLPIPTQLVHNPDDKKVVFHPLMESIVRGPSVVIDKLLHCVNIKLNYTVGIIMQSLLSLIASAELHSRLSPQQHELLLGIESIDDKVITAFTNAMLQGMKTKPDRLFINLYLKKGGKVKDKKYASVGIISFPFFSEIDEMKVRVKDKTAFKQLFKFMFPDIDDKEAYNYGSESRIAPVAESLLKTSGILAVRLNELLNVYKDYIDNPEMLVFKLDWLDYFDNLEDIASDIRKIPMQSGNEGSIGVQKPTPPPATQFIPQPINPGYPQPYHQPAQQPIQQPQTVVTNRGIDFRSLVNANPQLIGNAQRAMPAYQQPQQRTPSWARTDPWNITSKI